MSKLTLCLLVLVSGSAAGAAVEQTKGNFKDTFRQLDEDLPTANAYRTAGELNAEGCTATIDVLGEDSTDLDEVRSAVELYLQAIRGIHEKSLRCGISVKLSELGLRFDVEQCRDAIRTLVGSAAEHERFVRIDMEDSSVTDVTLDIYRELRADFDKVGTVRCKIGCFPWRFEGGEAAMCRVVAWID